MVLMRAIWNKNVIFIEFEPLYQNLWALMSNYQSHSPNMVMSCDPDFNFQKFLFFA